MGLVTYRFNYIKLYHIICSTPVFPCFSVLPGVAAQLATLAANRPLQGFRPSTMKQYDRMWRDFIAYQVAAGLPPCQVNTEILLSFMEFLHHNSLSSSHIANYMAALRAFHIVHSMPTLPFKDERFPIMAMNQMLHAFPASNNDPLFLIPHTSKLLPLTDSVARKHLKNISTTGTYNETWDMEIGCRLGIPFIPPLCYISRVPCFPTITSPIVLLGVWVNSSIKKLTEYTYKFTHYLHLQPLQRNSTTGLPLCNTIVLHH